MNILKGESPTTVDTTPGTAGTSFMHVKKSKINQLF
jgi:hypothetical protein